MARLSQDNNRRIYSNSKGSKGVKGRPPSRMVRRLQEELSPISCSTPSLQPASTSTTTETEYTVPILQQEDPVDTTTRPLEPETIISIDSTPMMNQSPLPVNTASSQPDVEQEVRIVDRSQTTSRQVDIEEKRTSSKRASPDANDETGPRKRNRLTANDEEEGPIASFDGPESDVDQDKDQEETKAISPPRHTPLSFNGLKAQSRPLQQHEPCQLAYEIVHMGKHQPRRETRAQETTSAKAPSVAQRKKQLRGYYTVRNMSRKPNKSPPWDHLPRIEHMTLETAGQEHDVSVGDVVELEFEADENAYATIVDIRYHEHDDAWFLAIQWAYSKSNAQSLGVQIGKNSWSEGKMWWSDHFQMITPENFVRKVDQDEIKVRFDGQNVISTRSQTILDEAEDEYIAELEQCIEELDKHAKGVP